MNSTIISFLIFTGLVGLVTWLMTRKDDHQSSDGYFLGGRSLTFPFIAGSLLLTNLSTEQVVGVNGAAFGTGLQVMVWEVVAVVALVLMALFFLPKFFGWIRNRLEFENFHVSHHDSHPGSIWERFMGRALV